MIRIHSTDLSGDSHCGALWELLSFIVSKKRSRPGPAGPIALGINTAEIVPGFNMFFSWTALSCWLRVLWPLRFSQFLCTSEWQLRLFTDSGFQHKVYTLMSLLLDQ